MMMMMMMIARHYSEQWQEIFFLKWQCWLHWYIISGENQKRCREALGTSINSMVTARATICHFWVFFKRDGKVQPPLRPPTHASPPSWQLLRTYWQQFANRLCSRAMSSASTRVWGGADFKILPLFTAAPYATCDIVLDSVLRIGFSQCRGLLGWKERWDRPTFLNMFYMQKPGPTNCSKFHILTINMFLALINDMAPFLYKKLTDN